MQKPDYHNSIVNLVASISAALGGAPGPYPALDWLEQEILTDGAIVLLIVDGLGDAFLEGHPGSFLHNNRSGRLSSVFPTTTATAITSFMTGVAAQQHAITGWFMWLRELGCVATTLPFNPRYRGPCFDALGLTPRQFIGNGSLFDQLAVECHTVNPAFIADSPYSLALSGRAQRHSYRSFEEMAARITEQTADGRRKLLIAYWPEFDSLAHENGIGSEAMAGHFAMLDKAIGKLHAGLRQCGARLLITADHGLIDTDEQHTIRLDDHLELADCLALPLCGEPRTAYCYVRPGKQQQFEHYVTTQLGHACQLMESAQLIAAGYFGLGDSHPQLQYRVGDYTLQMKENYVIRDRLLTEKPFTQRGVHGGLSPEELYVPLIIPVV
jgi:hypothetical protein